MGISYGPKLPDKDKLMLQVFPGVTNLYTDDFSNTYQVLPVDGHQFIGASGNSFDWPNSTPAWTADVANTGDTGDTYTIYSMVSVKFPPYKMINALDGEGQRPIRRRRFQIARIPLSSGEGLEDFRIGVLCPYYRTNSTGSNYKGIYAPIAFSFGFKFNSYSFSFTTDYKFNLGDWYTLAIEVYKASSSYGGNKRFRVFINGELQNVTLNRGLDWNLRILNANGLRGNYNRATYNTRGNSAIHARSGFIAVDGSVKTNQSVWDVNKVPYFTTSPVDFTIPMLNFTPTKIILGPDWTINKGAYTRANGVHYGPLMIYRDFYNNKVYEQFKTLNN